MARVHKTKTSTKRGTTITPSTPGAKTTATSYKYKRRPKGAPATYKAPVATKSTTTTAAPSTPTYRTSYVTYEQKESSRPSIPTVAGTVISAATPNQSPAPQGKGELVFAAGTGLILLSGFAAGRIQPILDMIMNGSKMKYTKQQARVGMVVLAGEFIFLMILTAISESSDEFSNVALALLVGLFLLWGITNVKTSSKWVEFITGKAKNI